MTPLRCGTAPAPVAQLAEAAASKSVQCRFESDPGHGHDRFGLQTIRSPTEPETTVSEAEELVDALPAGKAWTCPSDV